MQLVSRSDRAGANNWHRRAGVLSLGVLAALVAVLAVYSLYRARTAAGTHGDQPPDHLTIDEPDGLPRTGPEVSDRQGRDLARNEPAMGGATSPGPSSKDREAEPEALGLSSNRLTEPRDESRTGNEKPPPRALPAAVAPSRALVPDFFCVHRFRGHKGAVRAVAVSSDGMRALSAGYDFYAILWDIRTGKEMKRLEHPSEVLDVAMSPDGLFALTGTKGRPGTNGAIRVWNLSARKPAFKLLESAHVGAVHALALFPDGRALSGGHDGRVVLWNLNAGLRLQTLGQQQGFIHAHALAFFPRGGRGASGGKDRLVHIWNLAQGRETATWEGHRAAITSLCVSADGQRIATGSLDGTVILWDATSGSPIRSFSMPEGDRGASVAIHADGNVIAAGNASGQLILWDAESGAVLSQSQGPFVKHSDLAVLPDGQRILTGDADGIVRMWTVRTR
jgi:WD40 repeat protein